MAVSLLKMSYGPGSQPLVYGAVLVEEDCVHILPLKLVEKAVLHIVLVAEVELLEISGRVADELEVFLQSDTLVHPGNHAV